MQKNILLIDSDLDDAKTFSEALGDIDLDANLIFLGNGVSTLNRLLDKTIILPDVIFLDVNMPVIDGWDCLRVLKDLATVRGIPIVMYSSMEIEKEGTKASDVGATALMNKPTDFESLKKKLIAVLDSLFPRS